MEREACGVAGRRPVAGTGVGVGQVSVSGTIDGTTDGPGRGPLVSVVIPVYKVAGFLDECVASVAAQTYRDLEILLVDDGSPDECPAMCDAWAARDSRVRVIHKPNGGLSDARNAGIAASTGDYIYFADSDDVVAPNLVADCLAAMREYDADLVMFQFDTISENGRTLLSNYRHNDFSEVQVLTPVEAIKMQVKAEIDGYFWAFLAPASTYRGTGFSFPVGRKIEDLSRICTVIGSATRVVRIPEVLYHYRMREGSITAGLDPQLTRDWMKAADDREAYIDERFPELKGFMKLQQLNFFANLDYETMRQSLIAGLRIDPEDADALRRRIEGLRGDVERDDDETIPDALRELLALLKEAFERGVNGKAAGVAGAAGVGGAAGAVAEAGGSRRSGGTDGSGDDGKSERAGRAERAGESDGKPNLAEVFRDMREDWRQLRIQWADDVREKVQEKAEEHVEQARERLESRIDEARARREERRDAREGVIFEPKE